MHTTQGKDAANTTIDIFGRTDHMLSVLVGEGPIAVFAPIPARVPYQHARLKTQQAQRKVQRSAPPVRGEILATRSAYHSHPNLYGHPILNQKRVWSRVMIGRPL